MKVLPVGGSGFPGFMPKYSDKDALVRKYKWYLENLSSCEHQGGISHRVPWKEEIQSL